MHYWVRAQYWNTQKKQKSVFKAEVFLSYSEFSQELITKFDYSSEVVCEEPGQFAVRGGLIDIYPVNADFPVRIDFFGDTVEEIRSFDPTSQRTVSILPEISISSMGSQYAAEREGEFFRYLPDQVFWHIEEPENLLRCHPMAFHETGKMASEKANLSLLWKRKKKYSILFWLQAKWIRGRVSLMTPLSAL